MDIPMLTTFFMWCTIINGGILIVWTVFFLLAPDLVYRTQSYFVPISRETFNMAMYGFIGFFKIIFLFFNVVPYVVLLII